MTDENFGHSGYIVAGLCVDSWNAGPYVIEAGGKIWRFEDSDRFGPFILRKDGEIAARQPDERSPFWKAHMAWVRQGRRLDGDRCIYQPLKPEIVEVRGRQIVRIVQEGDPDGGMIVLPVSEPTP